MATPKKDVNRLSKQCTDDYLRRSSVTYLECCISLMLTHMPPKQVARILEQEAHFIRDLD